MDNEQIILTNATASGVLADAPVLADKRDQGAGVKYVTGQHIKFHPNQKLTSPKYEIRLAAWNVRTGHHVGQKEIIARELSRHRISIAALSELRLTGSGKMTFDILDSSEVMTLFFSGGDKHFAGVGFMLDYKAANIVLSFKPISNRIAVLVMAGTVRTHIVSIYAPTNEHPDVAKDEFYDELQQTFDSIPKTDLIIVAGDLNAHVGSDRRGWERILGKFGLGETNDNGVRLLSFATCNNLLIGNSLFQHPRKHQITWRAPNGRDTTILDYVLINKRFRSSLKDVRAMRGPDCDTDHYLVCTRIQLRLQRVKQQNTVLSKRDWSKLTVPAVKEQFQLSLANRFASLAQSDNVDIEEKQITEAISDCVRTVCPPTRRKLQIWISDNSLDMIDRRKRVKLTDYKKYRDLNKAIRNQLKSEREAYWNNVAVELEEAAQKNQYSFLYSTLRRLNGKFNSINDNIRKGDGTFVSSSNECLQRWQEFFQKMYNHEEPSGSSANPSPIPAPDELVSDAEPTISEVKIAIKLLKANKAPGFDGVTAEALKAGGDILIHRLHSLLLLIWRAEQIPLTWKRAIIIPLLKKGDSSECKNYRGISLLSIVGKTFTRILHLRLQKYREQITREEQAGFRPGRGCIDQIFAIRQFLEDRIRCNKRKVIVFLDFKAAFDSIYWPALWNTLQCEFIPKKIIHLLQDIYSNSSSCIRIHNELSAEFPIKSGVRQGCTISPLLFNSVIDAIMKKAFEGRQGVQYDESHHITDLMFADDSAFFANDDIEATDILNDIANAAHPYGLKINTDKTKVLTSDGSPAIVHLQGSLIEQVHRFKYLGSLVQEKKVAATAEVHSRIGLAAAAFGSLDWCLWKKRNISIQTKIRIFRTLIMPVLLYGSESWTLLKADLNKLEVFQMKCLRRMLEVSLRDRLRNEIIRKKCVDQLTIEDEIQKRRLRWFGHVCRMTEHRLPYRLLWRKKPTHWKIPPKAPKKTWSKQIEQDLKNRRVNLAEAKQVALDRLSWKAIIRDVRCPAAPTAAYQTRRLTRLNAGYGT